MRSIQGDIDVRPKHLRSGIWTKLSTLPGLTIILNEGPSQPRPIEGLPEEVETVERESEELDEQIEEERRRTDEPDLLEE
ncbi:MAG: hypothetical protein ACNA8W_13925 [Bradymonadaceae bacterium]